VSVWTSCSRLDKQLDNTTLYHIIKASEPEAVRYSKYLTEQGLSPTLLSCWFVVDLEKGLDRIVDEMDRTRRRGVRKGRENGVEVEAEPLEEAELEEFYEAYRRNMEHIDGSVFPRSFFTALAEQLPDRAMVFTATHEGDVIGRYLHVLDEEQSKLRYFFSAIGDDSHYEHNVSGMPHIHAMEWSIERGYTTYDFGATDADFSDGLFK